MTPAKARDQLSAALCARDYLRLALKHSKTADNRRTVARIRLALSSAKGAVRICSGRLTRAERRPA